MCGWGCTSNNGKSWARNLGRLTSIIDRSSRISSFSSGNFSCDMLNTGREKGLTLNNTFACAVTFGSLRGENGIQPHCLCSFFTIAVICDRDPRGFEHAFVSRSNFKMAKECSLGCDGAKIAVKMTQTYSFHRTEETTQAAAIQIWKNEKSEPELSRSVTVPPLPISAVTDLILWLWYFRIPPQAHYQPRNTATYTHTAVALILSTQSYASIAGSWVINRLWCCFRQKL